MKIMQVANSVLTLYLTPGGDGAESEHTNFKDSYLRNGYCYCNDHDNHFFKSRFDNFYVCLKCIFIISSGSSIPMLSLS